MSTMKKIILATILVAVTLVMFSNTSKAMTKEELKDYICTEKKFNGTETLIIKNADKAKVERFFKETEMTDEQAGKIKDIVDKAVAFMSADGAVTPNELSTKAKKDELLNYAKEAAKVVGMEVTYDATETRLDIYKNGAIYDSLNWGVKNGKGTSESSLVQTGSTNYFYIIIAGIVVIAGTMLIISRKKRINEQN